MHELRDGVVTRQASVEAQMYDNNAVDEETEVEENDDDEQEEAAAEAQCSAELCAAEVRVKAAAEAERVAAAEAERVAEAEAAEQAMHWAAEMDKALAYRRDVDRSTTARWDVLSVASRYLAWVDFIDSKREYLCSIVGSCL
jgi:hypothetical protein